MSRWKRTTSRGMRTGQFERLEDRFALTSISFQFDYSLDTNHFFDAPERRAALEEAGRAVAARLEDNLSAILPSGGNTWTATLRDPSTGQDITRANLTIPARTVLVFVGAYDLDNATLAIGGHGSAVAAGSSLWQSTVATRGQSNVAGSGATDFAPWGGSITFDSSFGGPPYSWNFGGPIDSFTQYDFVSIAKHELMHVLGFGTSDAFHALVKEEGGFGKFTGTHAIAENTYQPGQAPLLADDHSHWHSVHGGVMATEFKKGDRRSISPMDWAALDDIGWELRDNLAPAMPAQFVHELNPEPEDTVNFGNWLLPMLEKLPASQTDADPDADQGIAIVGADQAHGRWQYQQGTDWVDFGQVSSTNALLLRSSDTVQFVPAKDYYGESSFTFRLWDRTNGDLYAYVNTSSNGGETAFSTGTGTAHIQVQPLPDAPIVTRNPLFEDQLATPALIIQRNAADGPEVAFFKIYPYGGGSFYLADGVTPVSIDTYLTPEQAAAGLSYKPEAEWSGDFSVEVSAYLTSPSEFVRSSTTAQFTVTAVNDPPSFTAGPGFVASRGNKILQWATDLRAGPFGEGLDVEFIWTSTHPELFIEQPKIDSSGRVRFSAVPSVQGVSEVTAYARDFGGTENGGVNVSPTYTFQIAVNTFSWQNHINNADVDGDFEVTPLDALTIINELNAVGPTQLSGSPVNYRLWPDVNADWEVTPVDALLIINHLNDASSTAATASAAPASASAVSEVPAIDITDDTSTLGDERDLVMQDGAVAFDLATAGIRFIENGDAAFASQRTLSADPEHDMPLQSVPSPLRTTPVFAASSRNTVSRTLRAAAIDTVLADADPFSDLLVHILPRATIMEVHPLIP